MDDKNARCVQPLHWSHVQMGTCKMSLENTWMHGKYVLTWTQFPGCNVAIIGMPSVIAGMEPYWALVGSTSNYQPQVFFFKTNNGGPKKILPIWVQGTYLKKGGKFNGDNDDPNSLEIPQESSDC